MTFVVFWVIVNLSFAFSATISEWDDGNVDMSEPLEFESTQDIMSYLENNYWKDSRPADNFNQVSCLAFGKRFDLTTLILVYWHCVQSRR